MYYSCFIYLFWIFDNGYEPDYGYTRLHFYFRIKKLNFAPHSGIHPELSLHY